MWRKREGLLAGILDIMGQGGSGGCSKGLRTVEPKFHKFPSEYICFDRPHEPFAFNFTVLLQVFETFIADLILWLPKTIDFLTQLFCLQTPSLQQNYKYLIPVYFAFPRLHLLVPGKTIEIHTRLMAPDTDKINKCYLFSSVFRENTYVRAVGHLKSFKENSRSLIAFSLSPVLDFNEITHHMLDIIHSHLALNKVRTV